MRWKAFLKYIGTALVSAVASWFAAKGDVL